MLKRYQLTLFFCLISGMIFSQVQNRNDFLIGFDRIEKIIDGDTFRLLKLQKSFRLMCIDTEETFKGKNAEEKTQDITRRWNEYYLNNKRSGNHNKPAKIESPFGYKTLFWAKQFFKDVDSIRIEIDNSDRVVDAYGRDLVYIFAYKGDKILNYNLECVREGYSPYFNKYGNSRRFHSEFIEAQNEAVNNNRGIWSGIEKCYPDYNERIEWWNYRASQIENFEELYSDNPGYINLMRDDAVDKLNANLEQDVIFFGDVSDVYTKRFPYIIRFGIAKGVNLDAHIYEEHKDILNNLDRKGIDFYLVYLKGVLHKSGNGYYVKLASTRNIWME